MSRLFALGLLLLLSPIFFVLILCIYLEDGRPIFFKQVRVGKDNKSFVLFKFRSMRNNTPNVATHLLTNPSLYLLKTGRIIRKLSLDELPNLFNIIKGEMNFVGPRPALYNQYDLIALRVEESVHKLKPGITGWAQINGRDDLSIQQKVSYDKDYLQRKSLCFDMLIMVKTFISVFTSNGVSH